MRIVVAGVLDVGEPRGDTIHLLSVASALAGNGHDVTVLVPRPSSGAACLDIPAVSLRYVPDVTRWKLPRVLNSVIQALLLPTLSPGPALLYSRFSLLSFVLLAAARIICRIPTVSEHNGWSYDERRAIGHRAWLSGLERWAQVTDAKLATRVRVVVSGIGTRLAQRGVQQSRLFTAGNGCDISRVKPVDRLASIRALKLDETRTYVTFVGNLTVWQGLETGLDAFAQVAAEFPRSQLLIVGDGVCRESLEQRSRMLALSERVTFLGTVPPALVPFAIGASAFCIAPFTQQRNASILLSPIKIREYAAAGRAVVAADLLADPQGTESWLVRHPPDDSAALAHEMRRLLGQPGRCKTMGDAARAHAERAYSWDGIARQILDAACDE